EAGSDPAAHPRRAGVLERAHGGTLLLDEVSDMPLETQGKIVRALQDQTFERLGGSSRVKVDVRVLSTTNRDLQAEIAAGRFREDLYYRLAVVPVKIPALRERRRVRGFPCALCRGIRWRRCRRMIGRVTCGSCGI